MSKRVLGLWNMGEGLFHRLLSPNEAKSLLRHALDIGINSFDTAFSYKNADNYLASVIKERKIEREHIEIISKVMAVPSLDKKAEISLKRLNTDYVDILLLHWPSDNESIYSSLKKLESIKEQGKARAIGVSNFPIKLLEKFSSDFELSFHERPLSLLWTKDWERERHLGIKTIAYSPLAMGILSKTKEQLEELEDARKNLEIFKAPSLLSIVDQITVLSEKHSADRASICYAFLHALGPEYIVQGASAQSQLTIKEAGLSEEELSSLIQLSKRIDLETASDNIFSHSYLPSTL